VRETLSVCDQAYIVSQGKILVSGDASQVVSSEAARKMYLGEHFSL
jgi:lipopolysaccharide export system ATP-binding protein